MTAIQEKIQDSQVSSPAEKSGSSPRAALFALVDKSLVGLVVLFAFLTACFPVGNSDFFLHLASGRLLAQGHFPFGEDPFAFTTKGTYWTNHSWLFDLAVYGLYSLPRLGGEIIVACKALVVAGLAVVLLLTSRKPGQGPWIPCAATALAVLVISPRLLLQPICLSYLFLAVTLWLLQLTERAGNNGEGEAPAEPGARGEREGEAPAEPGARGEREGEAPAEPGARGEREGEAPAEPGARGEREGEAPAEPGARGSAGASPSLEARGSAGASPSLEARGSAGASPSLEARGSAGASPSPGSAGASPSRSEVTPAAQTSLWRRWVRSGWLLPPLVALWVNVDGWFLLGPIAIALSLLGQILQERWEAPSAAWTAPSRRVRSLFLILLVCTAVCLINPDHIHGFELPWQLGLSAAGNALGQDYEFGMLFLSPLENAFFNSGLGQNAATLALGPLVVLGLASFILNREQVRWSRVLLWTAFLASSLLNHRAIPFFAIVAGPITALNFLESLDVRLAQRAGPQPTWYAARGAAVLLGLGLIVVTIPGWLQANPAGRQVGLGVAVDPSLRAAALQIKSWREKGLLSDRDRLFNTTPDAANYLAWFCPREQSFLDLRLPIFPEAARDFVAVRAALSADPKSVQPAWRDVFSRWGVRYLVLHCRDPRHGAARAATRRLLLNPDGVPGEWAICYLDGRTIIARWNGLQGKANRTQLGVPELDTERQAFGPGAVSVPTTAVAPTNRPWWITFWRSEPARSLAGDDAYLQFFCYQVLRQRWAERNQQAWEGALAASIAGTSAARGGPVVNGGLLLLHIDSPYWRLHAAPGPAGKIPLRRVDQLGEALLNSHLNTQEAGPVSLVYLALRAGRSAVAEHPHDADTWFLLGQVYLQLAWRTGDLDRQHPFPHLALTRQTQTAVALQRALRSNPDHLRAHEQLAEMSQRALYLPPAVARPMSNLLLRRNLEVELRHRREVLRCTRKTLDAAGNPDAARQLEQMEKQVKALEELVGKRRDQYELASARQPNRIKAEMALDAGLAETALDVLLSTQQGDDKSRGPDPHGAVRVVELLLSMGRSEEAAELLRPEARKALGTLPAPLGLPAYEWFHLQVAAAEGNQQESDENLARILDAPMAGYATPSGRLAVAVGHLLLQEAPLATGMPWQVARKWPFLVGLPVNREGVLNPAMQQAVAILQQQADLLALRGCLALEAGAISMAHQQFHDALVRCQIPWDAQAGKTPETKGDRRTESIFFFRGLPLTLRYKALLEANEVEAKRVLR